MIIQQLKLFFGALGLITLSLGCSNETVSSSLVYDYIKADQYRKLVIEVDYVPEKLPREAVESQLISGLGQLLDKPDGIQIIHDKKLAAAGSDHSWSFEELKQLAVANYDLPVPTGVTKMHTIIIDGHSAEDTSEGRVLGLSWANRYVALFKDSIDQSCGSLLPLIRDKVCSFSELAVWTHEIGHVIGLVDNGLAMQVDHHDPSHSHHCANPKCLMYWSAETSSIVQLIKERITGNDDTPLALDKNCTDDISAVRGQ